MQKLLQLSLAILLTDVCASLAARAQSSVDASDAARATITISLTGQKGKDYLYDIGIKWERTVANDIYFLATLDGDGDYYVERRGIFTTNANRRVPYSVDFDASSYPMSWLIMKADNATYPALRRCVSRGVCHLNSDEHLKLLLENRASIISNTCIHDKEVKGMDAITCSK